MTRPPRIAITMGDPAGIGPEIILQGARALADRVAQGALSLLVVGTGACMDRAAAVLGCEAPPRVDAAGLGAAPGFALVEASPGRTPVPVGRVSAEGGRLAYAAIERAVALAMDGTVDAIVTAPLNKEALNKAGYAFAGHTDMLAALTGSADSAMMLVHGGMRVSHVTTHVALADVPRRVTPERLRRVIDLTADALRRLGIETPRIAVAALNPHAGEGGIFGREDIDVSAPVIAACVAEGLDVSGPVPGDTVFVKLRGGRYDAVIAMYHDQGHIPVKLLGFDVDPETGAWRSLSGVNVTLGLPIIRTSVDHGTAFDIAGTGTANADSLVEAVDLALCLSSGAAARR